MIPNDKHTISQIKKNSNYIRTKIAAVKQME